VRWDWENDGNWDTDWSSNKTVSHQYSSAGNFTVAMEVKDSEGLTDAATRNVTVEEETNNTPPTAMFTVNPEEGTTETEFYFDASGCSDTEDSTDELEVRWDWENDGNWDTGWSTDKTETRQYNSEGNYTIKLEVRDTQGIIGYTTKDVEVTNSSGNFSCENHGSFILQDARTPIICNSYFFVTAWKQALYIYDFSNPFPPQEINQLNSSGASMEFYDNHLYINQSYWGKMEILDITDVSNPQWQGTYTYSGGQHNFYPSGLEVYDNRAFIYDYNNNEIHLVDVADKDNPELLDIYSNVNNYHWHGMKAINSILYIGSLDELTVLSYNNDQFSLKETYFEYENVRDIEVVNDKLVLVSKHNGNQNKFIIFDFSNPDVLIELSSVNIPCDFWRFDVYENHVFIATEQGLFIVDISDPSNAKEIFFENGEQIMDITIDGNIGYARHGNSNEIVMYEFTY